jgi:hypothetical protein
MFSSPAVPYPGQPIMKALATLSHNVGTAVLPVSVLRNWRRATFAKRF